MRLLKKVMPLAVLVSLLGAPVLTAWAEGGAAREPASTHKTKKKAKAHAGKATKKKSAKKAKKGKTKVAARKAKKKHSARSGMAASHAPTHAPVVDGADGHMPVPGDVAHEQKADLPPPNNGTLTE